MRPKSARNNVNKAEWIRNQAASLTAKELVEKAKKESIGITVQQVYTVRSAAKSRASNGGAAAAAAPAAPTATAKKKPGPKPKAKTASEKPATASKTKKSKVKVNKSAWIREQPTTLTAKEVVAKAKKEGIKLSDAMVYTVRSEAKKAAGASAAVAATTAPVAAVAPAAATTTRKKPGPKPKTSVPASNASVLAAMDPAVRQQLIELAVRVGTDNAQILLDSVRQQRFA